MLYSSEIWCMTDVIVIFILGSFCPFIQKMKKKCLEISSFYTSAPKIMIIYFTVPEIWCMMVVIVTFHFGLCFALLSPLTAQKMNISKKWKQHLDISSFNTSAVPKIMIICFTVPEMWRVTDVIVSFHFLLFFAKMKNNLKNENFTKMNKMLGDIII